MNYAEESKFKSSGFQGMRIIAETLQDTPLRQWEAALFVLKSLDT